MKCEVTHPKLYLGNEGKLRHIPKGTVLDLTEKQAANLIKTQKVKVQLKPNEIKLKSKQDGGDPK